MVLEEEGWAAAAWAVVALEGAVRGAAAVAAAAGLEAVAAAQVAREDSKAGSVAAVQTRCRRAKAASRSLHPENLQPRHARRAG